MDLQEAREVVDRVAAEPKKVLFGIDDAIDNLVLAMFTLIPYDGDAGKWWGQAHTLFMDVPGVGKTGLIRTLSKAVDAESSFIPGDPTKMPKDIVGGERFDPKTGEYYEIKGPAFAHIVHLDEINRDHPKSLSLALQMMEERQAIITRTDRKTKTMEERSYPLYPISGDYDSYESGDPLFFWVLATANPIEMGGEGAYTIPEALLDRFSFSMSIGYPDRESERLIRADQVMNEEIRNVVSLSEVLEIAHMIVDEVEMTEQADRYIMNLIGSSRPTTHYDERRFCSEELEEYIDEYVKIGISPRVNFHFSSGARTAAFMAGRDHVTPDDVKRVAHLVMDHRIIRSNSAVGHGKEVEEIVQKILDETKVPS